jgi:hypothetical protein
MEPEIESQKLEPIHPQKKLRTRRRIFDLVVVIGVCIFLVFIPLITVKNIIGSQWQPFLLPFIDHPRLDLSASTIPESDDAIIQNLDPNYTINVELVGGYFPSYLNIEVLVDGQRELFREISDRSLSHEITLGNGMHDVQVRLIARWLGQNMTLDSIYFRVNQQRGSMGEPPFIVGLETNESIYHIAGYTQPGGQIFFDPVLIKANEREVEMWPNAFFDYRDYSRSDEGLINGVTSATDGHFDFWFSLADDSKKRIELFTDREYPNSGTSVYLDLEYPVDFSKNPLARKKQAHIDIQFDINKRGITKKLVIQVDDQNDVLTKLIEGKVETEDFVRYFVGPVYENKFSFADAFTYITPEITIKEGKGTVTFENTSRIVGQISVLGESKVYFKFMSGFPLLGHTGLVSVKVNGLDVTKYSPTPRYLENHLYSWEKLSPEEEITFKLIRSPRDFIYDLSSFSLYDLYNVPFWLSQALWWISDLVQAAPILWLIAILIMTARTGSITKRDIIWIGSVFIGSLTLLLFSQSWYLLSGAFNALEPILGGRNFFFLNLIPAPLSIVSLSYSDWLMLIFLFIIIFPVFLISSGSYHMKRYWQWILLKTINNLIGAFIIIFFANISLQVIFRYLKVYFQDLDITFLGWGLFVLTIHFLLSRLWQRLKIFNFTEHLAGWEPYIKLSILILAAIIATPNKSSTAIQFLINTNRIDYLIISMFYTLSSGALYFSFFGVVALLNILGYSLAYKNNTLTERKTVLHFNSFLGGYLGSERIFLLIAQVLFAGFVVGTDDQWLFIPVSFLLAVWLFRYLFRPAAETATLFFNASQIRNQRSNLIANIGKSLAAGRLESGLDDLLSNLTAGKILPSEYEKSVAEIRSEQAKLQLSHLVEMGISPQNDTFAIGPFDNYKKNAVFAVRWGLLFTVPLVFIYLSVNVEQILSPNLQFFWLTLVVHLAVFIVHWIIISFFYGATYDYLRGSNGLKKALFLTGFIAAAMLPYRLFTINPAIGLSSLILEIGQIAYFLMALGIIFTWEILRENGYSFRHLRIVLADIPSLVSAGSLVVGITGTIIAAMLQGQLNELLSIVMRVVLPTFVPPG